MDGNRVNSRKLGDKVRPELQSGYGVGKDIKMSLLFSLVQSLALSFNDKPHLRNDSEFLKGYDALSFKDPFDYSEESLLSGLHYNDLQLIQKSNSDLELIKRAQQGDEIALAELTESYIPFISSIAIKYTGRGVEFIDLVNQGHVGFQQAVNKFDPDFECKLTTYAYKWIKQSIERSVIKNTHYNLSPEKWRQLATALRMLSEGMTYEEISDDLNISVIDLQKVLTASQRPLTLDGLSTDEQLRLSDMIPEEREVTPIDDAENTDLLNKVYEWIKELDNDAQEIMMMRFSQDKNLQDIANIMTVKTGQTWNKEGVRKKIIRSCEKVRRLSEKKVQPLSSSNVSMFTQRNVEKDVLPKVENTPGPSLTG